MQEKWVQSLSWEYPREGNGNPLHYSCLGNPMYRTGRLQSMLSQRVGNDLVTELSCCSVAKSCPTICGPMTCSMPGFPVLHYLLQFAQTHIHESVMPSNHLILCCPLLLLPSIFPSIRVVFVESALRIRWLKYCSFSFSISPSKEQSGLISFRIDWFDLHSIKSCSYNMWFLLYNNYKEVLIIVNTILQIIKQI